MIAVEIGDDFAIRMTGPVTKEAEGTMAEEMFTPRNIQLTGQRS